MASKVKAPTTTTAPTSNGDLPKGWRMVRFGEVVRDVNEAERNPLDAGLERFVGLEHIEPENLHLKQWGLLADGDISFTKRFRKGQVLFGKRRAYQRKVAVAEFDGICSSDILTFQPKGDDLLPELLPFIVQSEGFFEHALGTSSGSLSPRTRWSQLQDYEFPLPPKDEQRRIAEILWAADEVHEKWIYTHKNLKQLRESYAAEVYGLVETNCDQTRSHRFLSEIVEINPVLGTRLNSDTEVSFIAMADVSETGQIISSIVRPYEEVRKGFTTFRDGDILFAKITPCMENGKGALASDLRNGIGFGSTEFHVLRPKQPNDADFVFQLTMTPQFRREAKRFMRGSAGQLRVPSDFLMNFAFLIPEENQRKEIGATLRRMTEQIEKLIVHQASIRSMYRLLMASLLEQ